MDFTIAIPTYNGAKRLPAVFEALEQQQDVWDITWEHLMARLQVFTPDLCVSHHIPASRFDRAYLLMLAKGCGLPTSLSVILEQEGSMSITPLTLIKIK